MKKILTGFYFLVAFAGAGLAQKTIHDANAEVRKVGSFHAVRIASGIDLYISQGNEEAVAVSAASTGFRDKIRTEVENGVLRIWYDYSNRNVQIDWRTKKMKAYVSVKNIDGLEASGGSDVFVDGTLSAPKLKLGISGGSDFDGKVSITELHTQLSGGSDMHISGKAASLFVDASGGSDFKGYDLLTDNSDVKASGGSDIYIAVNKELKADASGGSDIRYKGNAVIKQTKSGSSDITKVNK